LNPRSRGDGLTVRDPGGAEISRRLESWYAQQSETAPTRACRPRTNIATRLAADDPAKAEYHGDLSIGHNRIGIVLRSQGDAEGSLTELSAGLATSERLAALAVDDMTVQHNVAVPPDSGALPGEVAAVLGLGGLGYRLPRGSPRGSRIEVRTFVETDHPAPAALWRSRPDS
jgi:hypothetical protein